MFIMKCIALTVIRDKFLLLNSIRLLELDKCAMIKRLNDLQTSLTDLCHLKK